MKRISDLDDLVSRIDGSGSLDERGAVRELQDVPGSFSALMMKIYQGLRSAKARSSCVYYSIPYAREDKNAVELAALAIDDKSKIVRYRALMLLAYAQTSRAKSVVSKYVENNPSDEDASAALDALTEGNADYFVDRRHTGNIKLVI